MIPASQLHVLRATRNSVQEYLRSKQVDTVHKPARRGFTKTHTDMAGITAQWVINLIDIRGIDKLNGGVNYLFIVIDVFFNFA